MQQLCAFSLLHVQMLDQAATHLNVEVKGFDTNDFNNLLGNTFSNSLSTSYRVFTWYTILNLSDDNNNSYFQVWRMCEQLSIEL